MTHMELLEKSMIQYHGLFGWKSIPVLLEIKTEHFGDSRKHVDFGRQEHSYKMREWKSRVPQIEHMIEDLHSFKSCRLGSPASGLALLTGPVSNLLILDIDDEIEGLKFLSKIGVQIYRDSFRINTQSGRGCQFYFRWDERLNELKTTISKFFGKEIAIDLRGLDGLAFAVPSIVRNYDTEPPTFHRYTFPVLDFKMKVHKPPEALVRYLLAKKKDREGRSVINSAECSKTYDSLTENQKSVFEKIKADLSGAVVGTRSEKCFAAVCAAIKFKILPDDAFKMFGSLSKFSERDRTYFDDMWHNSCGYVDDTPYKKYDPPLTPVAKAVALINKPTAQEILNIKYSKEAPELIASPFFYRSSLSMICGDPGVGKTTMALFLSKAAVDQSTCWDEQIHFFNPCKVLFFHGDLNAAIFEKQYLAKMGMCIEYSNDLKFIILSDVNKYLNRSMIEDPESGGKVVSFSVLDSQNYTLYMQLIKEFKPDLVIIDTLSSFLSSDQNEIQSMTEVLQRLKLIAAHNKHHVILLHHSRKRVSLDPRHNKKMTLDDVRGSSAISASCDFILAVSNVYEDSGEKMRGAGSLHPIKEGAVGGEMTARFEEFNYKITNEKDGALRMDYWYGEGLYSKPIHIEPLKIDRESQFLMYLYNNPNSKSYDFISAISNITGNKTRQSMFDMKDLYNAGLIDFVKVGRHKLYSLTQKGSLAIVDKTSNITEISEIVQTDNIKELVLESSITRAMEDVMNNEPTKLTEEQIKSRYADRANWDDSKDFPVDAPEWNIVKDKWTEEQIEKCVRTTAGTLWFRSDRYGNLRYNDLMEFRKEEDKENFNLDLMIQMIRSLIAGEYVWYKIVLKDGKYEDMLLHPTRDLDRIVKQV